MTSAAHLGHDISDSADMESDARVKRAKFIDDSVSVRENFSFANPVEVLRATKVHCSALYGCMLWRLDGDGASKVFARGIPQTSLKSDVLARYCKFMSSLQYSTSFEVTTVANIVLRNVRSNTGANVWFLEIGADVDPSAGVRAIKRALSGKISQGEDLSWLTKHQMGYTLKYRCNFD